MSVSRMAASAVPVMPLTKPELVLVFFRNIIGIPLENAKNTGPFSLPVMQDQGLRSSGRRVYLERDISSACISWRRSIAVQGRPLYGDDLPA
jgi:hypothetical protein